jgi:hypothetical protein
VRIEEGEVMVSGRAAEFNEINDFSVILNDRNNKNDLLAEARSLTFAPTENKKEAQKSAADSTQAAAGEQSAIEELATRVRRNADNPEIQNAIKEFQKSTKGMDPKVVEDCLNLASDLAESGLKIPGMLKAEQNGEQNGEQKTDQPLLDENGQEIAALSGVWQTLLRKFSNPLVIKDVINIGKDLANIAMSPQGQSLIRNFRSLVVHLKEA